MTAEDIDKLEAGPELDALVAERVFGYRVVKTEHGYYCSDDIYNFENQMGWIPGYSTDIAAAWEVVDKLSQVSLDMLIGRWRCTCFDGFGAAIAEGETAPLAICRCALRAAESAQSERQ